MKLLRDEDGATVRLVYPRRPGRGGDWGAARVGGAPGAPVPCLAGPPGTGKTSLAVAAAAALDRAHVQVTLGGQDAESLIHGVEGGGAGRIVEGLCAAGVNNVVFVLEGIDRVDAEAADVLLDVLEPKRRRAFKDAYLDVPFDLSDALWIVTATDHSRAHERARDPPARALPADDLPQGGAGAGDGRRVAGA